MERNDFISGDAYYRYKFERESKNEEIQRLRTKMERMRTDNYVRVAYDSVVITVQDELHTIHIFLRGYSSRNEQRLAV